MANNLQEALWLRVAQFIKINENKPKLFVANHFIAEGVPKTTITHYSKLPFTRILLKMRTKV